MSNPGVRGLGVVEATHYNAQIPLKADLTLYCGIN